MTSPQARTAGSAEETASIENWLNQNVVSQLEAAGVEVQEDAAALLTFACQNQLRTGSVGSEAELNQLLGKLTPHLVSAYLFKYGTGPMTFGRAVRLLADMPERLKELRREG